MRIWTRASAAIDRGVARFMERRMSSTRSPLTVDARAQLVEVIAAYRDPARPFFPAPEPIEPRLVPEGEGPLGTQVIDLAWESGYTPFLAAFRERYLAHVENGTAHARWWTSGHARPVIVLLHGWAGGAHWMTARAFDVPYWLRHGYDVVAFQLPFHGSRAPLGKSGALFPSTNPARTNEGFGQAIYDLRGLAGWLRARGASAVGAMGMSLGGYVAALWATIEGAGGSSADLEFSVALIPAVSFASLMFRHGEHGATLRRAEAAGVSEELLAEAFAVHTPTLRAPALPRDRLFVVAGRGDRIAGPDQAELLAKHWGIDTLWFDGGHLAQLGRGDAMRVVRRRLGALELPGRTFRAA